MTTADALLARIRDDGFPCPTCAVQVVLTKRGTIVVHGTRENGWRCPRSGESPDGR